VSGRNWEPWTPHRVYLDGSRPWAVVRRDADDWGVVNFARGLSGKCRMFKTEGAAQKAAAKLNEAAP
jgi:hypothetical protein